MIKKDDIIQLAKECFKWKEAKVISWYKLENFWLGGVSPKELVDRGQGQVVANFLEERRHSNKQEN